METQVKRGVSKVLIVVVIFVSFLLLGIAILFLGMYRSTNVSNPVTSITTPSVTPTPTPTPNTPVISDLVIPVVVPGFTNITKTFTLTPKSNTAYTFDLAFNYTYVSTHADGSLKNVLACVSTDNGSTYALFSENGAPINYVKGTGDWIVKGKAYLWTLFASGGSTCTGTELSHFTVSWK
jgi:hypothetical protein